MKQIVLPNPFDGPVYYTLQTTSTMDEIKKLDNPENGSIVITDLQTAGRGRITGRKWLGQFGENLYCSLYLDLRNYDVVPGSLPARVALSLSECLANEYNLQSRVKWPNDVLVSGKKISGILLEQKKNAVYIGFGVNCLQKVFPEGIGNPTSLALELESAPAPKELLAGFLPFIHNELISGETLGSRNHMLYNRNEYCRLLSGHPDSGKWLHGIIQGFAENGGLVMRINGRDQVIYSGEMPEPV